MPAFTRRALGNVIGATAAGVAGLDLLGRAQAAVAGEQEPPALLGTVKGNDVTLPPLHADTDLNGKMPNPDPVGRRLGVAVVGLGNLAMGEILPAFGQSRHMRVTALVSGEREKALVIARQYGVPDKNIYDYGNFDSLKNNPEVDVVYIVLPNALHAEYTVRAAQAGKHVLCEKPMATSVADAQRMVDACKQAGRKLMIAYRCQYTPEHRTLIDIVRSKQLGKMQLIQAVNGQNDAANGQWRQIKSLAGGGSLPDVGLYCLNATRYLTGEEPVEITARMTQPKDDPRFREIEDICAFTLRFPSGVEASCVSGYSFHETRKLFVMSEAGSAGLDPAFGYNNLTMHLSRRNGMSNGEEQRRWAPKSQFALEMDAYAEAIRNNQMPLTPGEEGLQDQKIMAAIYEAAAGGGVVKMPAAARLDATRGVVPEQKG
jgi:predicted dehydrogenase